MNRPRHSLLSLFDPLTAPETPLRDEESDKENCTPFSALFTRSNDHNPSTPVAPLRKRLVDVGDATLDDTSILDLLTEEQEPLSASVICLETPVPPFQRRTPLARLPLGDANSTPVVRFKPHSSPLLLSQVTPNANEINTPEILVSSCHSVDDQQSQHTIDSDSSLTLPRPPEADSPFQGNTESSTRLCAPSIASHRLSIDLQAAFQMHFQSNSSFDLLNDKISLIEPMESLLADDENFDFELERENLWDAMAKFKKECAPSKSSISSGRLRSQDDPTESPKPEAKSDPAPDTNSQREPWDDTLQSPTSPRGNSQPSQDLPTSPLDGKSSKRQSIPSKLPSPTARRSPIDSFPIPREEVQSVIPPQAKQRRLSTPLVTPRRTSSVAPPPAIQALRIVKRTTVHHPKESADDVGLRVTMNAAPHTIHERFYSSSKATGEETAPSTRNRQSILAKPVVASSTSSTKTVFGPRRVTVSESPVESTASKSNLTSQPITSGPKRMPISNAGLTVPPSKPSSITTGLKQPTRLESSLPITSNLPRPSGLTTRMSMSKLPGPSGTSRLRRPAGNLPRRVIAGE